jgi:hypothetical protein
LVFLSSALGLAAFLGFRTLVSSASAGSVAGAFASLLLLAAFFLAISCVTRVH